MYKYFIYLIITSLFTNSLAAETFQQVTIDSQIYKSIFLISFFSFLIIFILGISNKVIIFEDYPDLFWTGSLVLYPVILSLIIEYLTNLDFNLNLLFSNIVTSIWTLIFIFLFILVLLKTFFISIKSNGIFIGLIIAIFKIISSVILLLLFVSLLEKLFGKKNRGYGSYVISMILFGIFGMIVRKLINGPRVRSIRGTQY